MDAHLSRALRFTPAVLLTAHWERTRGGALCRPRSEMPKAETGAHWAPPGWVTFCSLLAAPEAAPT
eukprot:15472219-Alexandrium_andersonii.AAC.1